MEGREEKISKLEDRKQKLLNLNNSENKLHKSWTELWNNNRVSNISVIRVPGELKVGRAAKVLEKQKFPKFGQRNKPTEKLKWTQTG